MAFSPYGVSLKKTIFKIELLTLNPETYYLAKSNPSSSDTIRVALMLESSKSNTSDSLVTLKNGPPILSSKISKAPLNLFAQSYQITVF